MDDEKMKEGKRIIFPMLCSRLSRSRESARNREIERERERKRKKGRKRKKKRHRDPSSDGTRVLY